MTKLEQIQKEKEELKIYKEYLLALKKKLEEENEIKKEKTEHKPKVRKREY